MFMKAKLTAMDIRFLRWIRVLVFYLIEPVDFVSRLVNGKRDLPPLPLRAYAGPLSSLETSGAEFLSYMKLLCGVTSRAKVLDIGCGFGLMALYLKDYLQPPGGYTGLDINRQAIKWAERAITKRYSNFNFLHLDIRNAAYNPRGQYRAENVRFPFEDKSFDFVLLKSVFTHMQPEEVKNYLREVARLLAPKGVCLATFFLLNPGQERQQSRVPASLTFAFGDELWRYTWKGMPELTVAYSETEVMRMLHDAGLSVNGVFHGTWSGREDGLSFQDLLLVSKAKAPRVG